MEISLGKQFVVETKIKPLSWTFMDSIGNMEQDLFKEKYHSAYPSIALFDVTKVWISSSFQHKPQ